MLEASHNQARNRRICLGNYKDTQVLRIMKNSDFLESSLLKVLEKVSSEYLFSEMIHSRGHS